MALETLCTYPAKARFTLLLAYKREMLSLEASYMYRNT